MVLLSGFDASAVIKIKKAAWEELKILVIKQLIGDFGIPEFKGKRVEMRNVSGN